MSSKRISAISPRFFKEARDIGDLFRQFGPSHGRFIQEIPTSWFRKCKDEVDVSNFSEMSRKKTLEQLYLMQKRGYVINILGQKRGEENDFREDAKRSNRLAHYEFMIDASDSPKNKQFLKWDDAVEQIGDHPVVNWTSEGSARHYLEAIEPLLLSAHLIFMVDRYLDPTRNDTKLFLIDSVLKTLRQKGKCKELHVVTGIDDLRRREPSELKATLKNLYTPHIATGSTMTFHLLKENSKIDLHDRYFITDLGGLNLGRGFSLRKQSKISNVSITYLSPDNHKYQYDLYHDLVRGEKSTNIGRSIEIRGKAS